MNGRTTLGGAARDVASRIRSARTRFACTIGPERVALVRLTWTLRGPRIAAVVDADLEAAPNGEAWAGSLTARLTELGRQLKAQPGTKIDVAMLRPLAFAKVIELPPIRRRELPALLARNAGRFFPVPGEALTDLQPVGHLIGFSRITAMARREDPSPATVRTVATSSALAGTVSAAVSDAGLTIGRITAAPSALYEAVRYRKRVSRRRRLIVAAAYRNSFEFLFVDDGTPRLFVPLPRAEDTRPANQLAQCFAWVEEMHSPPPARNAALVLASESSVEDELLAALDASGTNGQPMERIEVPSFLRGTSPEAITAVGSAIMPYEAPHLVGEETRRERQRRTRRRTAIQLGAAAILLILSAGLHLWNMRREHQALMEARSAIAPAVEQALALRRELTSLYETWATIADAERNGPIWTAVIHDLAFAIPDSAHVARFITAEREIELNGLAQSATALARRLEESRSFDEVTLGEQRQWSAAGGRESYTLRLRLAQKTANATIAGVAGGGAARVPLDYAIVRPGRWQFRSRSLE